MKRALALFFVFIPALSGCAGQTATAGIEKADDVTITDGVYSSYIMSGAEQSVIDDLVEWFNQLSFEETNEEPDMTEGFGVRFTYEGAPVKTISFDPNGVATLDGGEQYYKISADTLNYDLVKNIYEQSRTSRPPRTIEWNDLTSVGEDPFIYLMKDKTTAELEYIKNGELIQIEFPGGAPNTVELKDYVLREDGRVKYSSPKGDLYEEIPVELIDGKGTFELKGNFASLLSSDSADYAPGATIRGFRMTCRWDGDEREYAFVFRSDAAITLHIEN